MTRSHGPSGSGAWINHLILNYIIVKTRLFFSLRWFSLYVFLKQNPKKRRGTHLCDVSRESVFLRERGGFYVTQEGRRWWGTRGGRNFKSCCRFHWERGKHQVNIYELSPLRHCSLFFPLFLSDGWTYLFQREDIYFRTTSGINQSADLCEPYAGVTDICEVEEEECIVSLWN